MKIEIDLNELTKAGLTPNMYCTLVMKANNISIFTADNSYLSYIEDCRKLRAAGALDEEGQLTSIGRKLVKNNMARINIATLAEAMRNIFPKGVKTGNQPVRSNLKDMEKKLKKFIKDYGYTVNEILTATAAYVDRLKLQQYQYMKTSSYFIYKQGAGSTLAAEIDSIKDGEAEPKRSFEQRL